MISTKVNVVWPGSTYKRQDIWHGKTKQGNERSIRAHFAGMIGPEIDSFEHAEVEGSVKTTPVCVHFGRTYKDEGVTE